MRVVLEHLNKHHKILARDILSIDNMRKNTKHCQDGLCLKTKVSKLQAAKSGHQVYALYLHIVYVCFTATVAELSSCDRDHTAHQATCIYYMTTYRKSLLTRASRDSHSLIYSFI